MNARPAAACWLAWMLVAAAPASAAYRVEPARLVSAPVAPPDPHCHAPVPPRASDQSLAADPRDPSHLVAAWMQDRAGPDSAGSQGLGVAVSRDGGRRWTAARVRGLTACDGGAPQHTAVNEAQVAIGHDGTVYVTGELHRGEARLAYVAGSRDGGLQFGAPAILGSTDRFGGQEAVTPDPLRHDHAYVSWHRVEPHPLGPGFATSVLLMARTTDAGASWSAPREVRRPGVGRFDVASRLLRPRDGSLVNVFVEQSSSGLSGEAPRAALKSIRSSDDGATWTAPAELGQIEIGASLDHERGGVVNRFAAPAATQAPDGTLYVVWRDRATGAASRIDVARSRDGGRSWTRLSPVAILGTQSFLPQIAVSRTGVVGVSYYDFRGERAGDGELTTRVWLATSVDGGNSWQEIPLSDPFDSRQTLAGDSSLIGDTTGLTGARRGFVATLNVGPPLTRRGVTDLLSAQVERCSVRAAAARCDPPLVLRNLRVRPSRIRQGRRARLSFRLPRAAGVSVVLERRRARAVGGRCDARRTRGRSCLQYQRKAVLSMDARAGRNSLRVATKRLPKGHYRATARAVDAIGAAAPARRTAFRIR